MAPRHVVAAIIFGIAIGLAMQYVLGGNRWIHMSIAIIGALAGAWFATGKGRRSGP